MLKRVYVEKPWKVGVFVRTETGVRWVNKTTVRALTATKALALAKEQGIVAPVIDGVDDAS